MRDGGRELIPGDFRPGFRRVFARWLRGFVGRRFHAVRAVSGTDAVLRAAAGGAGPVILACNHASWWDPLVGFMIHDRWFADRPVASPIDRTQLENFRFFRKLGMFGVDPDDAAGLRPFVRHVEGLFASAPRTILMMTPQGRFVDPRRPVEVRPGVAMVAARRPDACVVAVSIEYGFWTDQRPEVFMRAMPVPPPPERGDVHAWQAAIQDAMNANGAALAAATSSRDPSAFLTLMGGGAARIHPVYDAFLRLTGRRTAIETAHRAPERVAR